MVSHIITVMVKNVLHLWSILITFMADRYYIHGKYYIHGCYYIYG